VQELGDLKLLICPTIEERKIWRGISFISTNYPIIMPNNRGERNGRLK
jgi:hypothetical protein